MIVHRLLPALPDALIFAHMQRVGVIAIGGWIMPGIVTVAGSVAFLGIRPAAAFAGIFLIHAVRIVAMTAVAVIIILRILIVIASAGIAVAVAVAVRVFTALAMLFTGFAMHIITVCGIAGAATSFVTGMVFLIDLVIADIAVVIAFALIVVAYVRR